MKRILNLIAMLTFSVLMFGGFTFAQNNQQGKGDQSMDKQNTAQADTNYAKSMGYYKYAKKHIIQDSTKEKTYKGKWNNQKNTNMTSNSMMNNSNMKSSSNKSMNPNSSMMNNSKQNMKNNNMTGDSSHWKNNKHREKKK